MEYERRLMSLEHSVDLLRERSETAALEAKSTTKILHDLERSNIEIKSSVAQIASVMTDIRRDFDGLEKHTERAQQRHTDDLKEFADTVVSALADVSNSFKDIVTTATRALEAKVEGTVAAQEKINLSMETRVKALEQFYWKVTGGAVIVGTLVGAILPHFIKMLFGAK